MLPPSSSSSEFLFTLSSMKRKDCRLLWKQKKILFGATYPTVIIIIRGETGGYSGSRKRLQNLYNLSHPYMDTHGKEKCIEFYTHIIHTGSCTGFLLKKHFNSTVTRATFLLFLSVSWKCSQFGYCIAALFPLLYIILVFCVLISNKKLDEKKIYSWYNTDVQKLPAASFTSLVPTRNVQNRKWTRRKDQEDVCACVWSLNIHSVLCTKSQQNYGDKFIY